MGELRGHEGRQRWLPALVPLLVAVPVTLAFGWDRGVVLVTVAVAFAVAIALGLPVDRWIGVGVDLVVRGLAAVIGVALFVLLIVPAWAWTRLRRRSPLGRAAEGPTAWATVAPARGDDAAKRLGSELPERVQGLSPIGRLVFVVGAATLLVGANYLAGWAWDAATDEPPDPVTDLATGPESPPTWQGETFRDPRIDAPAMAAYPWREQYFNDIQKTLGGYWPFTENRPYDFSSPYLNIDGWVRRSYVAEGRPEDQPTVWMFGGSTTWGEGQRDEYTIASWLARLAEAEGTPIQIDNYGQRGWTHFQGMVLFEQQAALRERPDFALFYDGANEITTQSLLNEAVPTHTLTYQYANKLYGARIGTQVADASPADPWGAAVAAYREHSAVHKVLDYFRSDVAGAAPSQEEEQEEQEEQEGDGGGSTEEGFDDGFTGGQEVGEGGNIYNYKTTEQDGIDAGRVYERSKHLTLDVAERAGVTPLLFWQPVAFRGAPEDRAIEQLTEPTIDISRSLEDHRDVFIDGGHTNEEGARIVAEAIWEHLGPAVREWYEENG